MFGVQQQQSKTKPTHKALNKKVNNSSKHVPQPRLVCVELNPGPTPMQELVAGVGAALGQAVAKTQKKKVTVKKAKAEVRAMSKTVRKKANKSVKSAYSGQLLIADRLSGLTSVRAPIGNGYSFQSRTGKRNTIVTIPFNTVSNASFSSLSTSTYTTGFAVSNTLILAAYDLNPYNNANGGFMNSAFGQGMANLTKCFSKWRIKKLQVTYIPCCATTTPGSLAVGATGENFTTVNPTFQEVTDCEKMFVTPFWQAASIDITSVAANDPNQWLYTYVNGSTVAEQRQNYCCTLLLAAFGFPAPTTTFTSYGQFRFDGIVEFTDMSDIISGIASTVKVDEPAHSDAPSVMEECKEEVDIEATEMDLHSLAKEDLIGLIQSRRNSQKTSDLEKPTAKPPGGWF